MRRSVPSAGDSGLLTDGSDARVGDVDGLLAGRPLVPSAAGRGRGRYAGALAALVGEATDVGTRQGLDDAVCASGFDVVDIRWGGRPLSATA
jgi:hypothetical protein